MLPRMHAAKMSAVGETENPSSKFERNVHMSSIFLDIRAFEQLGSIRKPHKLSIKPKMQSQQTAIQRKKYIFPFAVHALNASLCCGVRQTRRILWFHRDRSEERRVGRECG